MTNKYGIAEINALTPQQLKQHIAQRVHHFPYLRGQLEAVGYANANTDSCNALAERMLDAYIGRQMTAAQLSLLHKIYLLTI
jgi:hypothetical protein